MTSQTMQPPKAVGLYDPRFEHDACGVGMVARLDNKPTHEVVARAIAALENLEHRGASGADPCTGDGAGILMQMPDELLRAVVDFELPPAGGYGVLMCFLPADRRRARGCRSCSSGPCATEGQRVLGWRDVPVRPEHTGEVARRLPARDPSAVRRRRRASAGTDQDAFERKLYVIRRVCELSRRRSRACTSLQLLADDQLQGHADQLSARRLLPRPAGRARQERAGARALALLDQHLPQLGARPPLPGDLPQRRDQHPDGQRQLDARARERAAQRAVRRRPAEDPAGRHARQLRLGDVRQRARAADARRAARCRTRR